MWRRFRRDHTNGWKLLLFLCKCNGFSGYDWFFFDVFVATVSNVEAIWLIILNFELPLSSRGISPNAGGIQTPSSNFMALKVIR